MKTFNRGGSLTVSEVQSTEHGGMQADVVLELRVLPLDSEATGSRLIHWAVP